MEIPWSITPSELDVAKKVLDLILSKGASGARVMISKSMLDQYKTLNGELDVVTHAGDADMVADVFIDGRFGSCSLNKWDWPSIEKITSSAIESIRMLEKDPFRRLPDKSRKISSDAAATGLEGRLYDSTYASLTPEKRLALTKRTIIDDPKFPSGCEMISQETSYSDSMTDGILIDSDGLEVRSTDSSFCVASSFTIKDKEGRRYSDFWSDYTQRLSDLDIEGCSKISLERTAKKINPLPLKGGRYTMALESSTSPSIIAPLLAALSGRAIQQKNSFMIDTLGKKVLPSTLTVREEPVCPGQVGCTLFEQDGVAYYNRPVIEEGVVREYYVDTYIAAKTGMKQTCSTARPVLSPIGGGSLEDMLSRLGKGILVTDFNGGNSNPSTGDFSFGVEGYYFEGGKIVHPVTGMLITGNLLTLWNSLVDAADDPIPAKGLLIPSLAFEGVDFSA